MSAHVSSRRLVFGLIVGPIAALANQGLAYAAAPWACSHDRRSAMHVIPALCLVISIAATVSSLRAHRARSGNHHDDGAEDARSQFMAITGIGTGLFSSLVIVAQWAAIVIFAPCIRA